MKHNKNLLAFFLAVIMSVLMAIPSYAFSAEGEYIITAPKNNHIYEIYQIFTGDYHEGVLSNIKWGENGSGISGENVSQDILAELTASGNTDTEKLDVIKKYVNLNSEKYGSVQNESAIDVPAGYYLIKDVDKSQNDKNDSYTLYIVKVADDIKITPKSNLPKLEKKVLDVDDTAGTVSDWQDSADYDIGDGISFQLKGTVASNYSDYKTYKFIFHDKESEGLTFIPGSVVVKVDGIKIDTGFNIVTENLSDDCTFEIRFENLKEILSVQAGSVITVEYMSTLNSAAVIGAAGNPNEAKLEFSNNPNDEQGGDTGTTPKDTVVVFTYKTHIDKVDNQDRPLAGAAFQLEKFVADNEGAETNNDVKGNWIFVTAIEADIEKTAFEFRGLDDGTYRLTEITTPDGYNTIAPIIFNITATHDTNSDTPEVTVLNGTDINEEITFTSNLGEGSLTTKVINQSGLELPETGGIGTAIFYVLGCILVIGAGVLLIAKKQMHSRDKQE